MLEKMDESIISRDTLERVQQDLLSLSKIDNIQQVCEKLLVLIDAVQVAQTIDSGDIKTGGDYSVEDDEEWNSIYELLTNTYEKYDCSGFESKVTEVKKMKLKESYIAFELDEKDRAQLLKIFPPKYPDVIAHHTTYKFGISPDAELPENNRDIEVVGYADDGESIEALVVAIDGQTTRPDGKTYHITWSLDREKGRKPVHSNNLIKEHGYERITPIKVSAIPKIF